MAYRFKTHELMKNLRNSEESEEAHCGVNKNVEITT